jgi:PAS domain S-box-containing protein
VWRMSRHPLPSMLLKTVSTFLNKRRSAENVRLDRSNFLFMQQDFDTAITSRVDDLYRKAIEDDVRDYAIFLTDPDANIINWNRGAERILGYKESEVLGKSAFIVFTAEDRAAHVPESEIETALAEGRAADERWHERRDKTRFWASGVLTAVRDESGELLGFLKVMQDMTERRRLAEERDRFFTLSMDLLCIVRLDGHFLRTNPAFEKVLGYSEDELRNHPVFDLLHPDDRAAAITEYERLRAGQPTKSLENRFRCKNGGYKWVAWSYYPVPEERIGYGVGRDISDMRRLTEALKSHAKELEEVNRVKDEFLAILSHELRTPLTSILGWARLLRAGKLEKLEHDRAIEIVERNAEAQMKLIEDLLDVSRIITGKLRIEFEPIELAEIVKEGVDEFRPAAEAKGIRLAADIDDAAGPILGDSTRLKQIVANLLSNAIKFTNEGGRIDISLKRTDRHARLRISDNGVGIDPAVLPHIFERFKQADSSNVRMHSGLGLGLAIVNHLVREHSGSVKAESAGQGKGSTFTVDFPVVPSDSETEVVRRGNLFSSIAQQLWKDPAHDPERSALQGITVLLVEDEVDTRDLVTTMLREFGARVIAVNSAKDALASIQQEVPNVMLSDIGMSGENGYDLIRKVRALAPEKGGAVPAVALTAYAGPSDRRRALIAGFHVHLAKPVEPDELLAVIASLGRIAPGPDQ